MTCDRCHARALHVASRQDQVLTFCGYHSNESRDSLTIQGWIIEPLTMPSDYEVVGLVSVTR